jgi:hypothetical protein
MKNIYSIVNNVYVEDKEFQVFLNKQSYNGYEIKLINVNDNKIIRKVYNDMCKYFNVNDIFYFDVRRKNNDIIIYFVI